MTTKDLLECERKSFHKQMKELKLLPNKYLQIGMLLSVAIIIALVIFKVLGDYELIRQILKNTLLLSMLLISISKSKEEDEMTLKLRGQSFVLAFVWGVLYAAAQPFIGMIVDLFIQDKESSWTPLTVNQVLFFMLLIQLAFYHFAKRMR